MAGATTVHYLSKKVGGSWSNPFSETYSWVENTFYVFEMQWLTASTIKLLIDNTLRTTVSTNLEAWTSGNAGIRGYHGTGDMSYYDWFLVRKCVSPEPTWGVWGSEVEVEGGGVAERIGIILKLLQKKRVNIKLSQEAQGVNIKLSQEAQGGRI